ncbi:hypothetical protein [Leptolyngbya sp. 7M]|uniref:hypothetical protein n=1 Tax=Leptolyngbya sp. 7M TaxID=2812896 RepID=UPI001B8ACF0D|nr:hypothetical protein [Leptolyngbya sp. 7M]QYO67315.1 hypothetical protein JVX88_11220 [Leptolyngbya sp. 7M]
MSLRDEVLEILRSAEAMGFGFTFLSIYQTPISVNSTTFSRVITAIEANRIQVASEPLARGRGGEYDPDPENGGALNLRPIRNRRYNKSAVVHEAVHASFDLTLGPTRTAIACVDDEVAAYLANTLYLRGTHYPLDRLGTRTVGTRLLYESLWAAAASIERNGSATETQIARIRRRLTEHPLYRNLLLSEGCSEEGEPCFYEVRVYNG